MPSWKKIIVSGSAGSLLALSVSTHITASGHVSASSTSTGSFGAVNVAGMSVSNLVDVSSSFSTRVSNLKTDSGSYSTRVSNLKTDSGSFSTRVLNLKTDSGSFSTRVTRNEATGSSLTTASSSFSTRVTRNEVTGSSLTTASSSFSTRVSTEESNVDSLQTDSGSFSTRVSNLKTDSGSYSTRVSNLKSDSGSFSTRVTTNEGDLTTLKGSGTAQGVGQSNSPTFVNITATGTMTAQEFHTEFVSSSIVYRSGSTKFGDTIDDIHSFTGSIHQSGSFNLNDGNMTIADTLTATTLTGTTIKDFSTISGSSTSTGSFGYINADGVITFGSLSDGTIRVTAWADEDNMSSDSATLVPTQQSVKAYVDSQVTAQDLDFQGDSGGALAIDLDSESLTIAGGTNATTVGSGNGVTVNVDDSFLVNDASDTTSGTITAAGLITSGNVSGSIISTGSFGRLEATIGPFFELDSNNDIMPL